MNQKDAIEMLKRGVNAISTSAKFIEWLNFSRRFHNYSLQNTLLIMTQRPNATKVAGFHKWKQMGRFVKRGERGIAILAPVICTKRDEATGIETSILRGFRVVYVFDVAQTDGKPIPENPAKKLEGEDGQGLYNLLAAHVTDSGLRLTIGDPMTEGANGSYDRLGKHIIIAPGLSPVQRLKTLCHEVAHWKLHSDDEGRILPRAVVETEAEAAAYLALAHFGIRADDYAFAYVAGWSGGNVGVLEKSLRRIQKGADAIIAAIEARLPKRESEEVAAA